MTNKEFNDYLEKKLDKKQLNTTIKIIKDFLEQAKINLNEKQKDLLIQIIQQYDINLKDFIVNDIFRLSQNNSNKKDKVKQDYTDDILKVYAEHNFKISAQTIALILYETKNIKISKNKVNRILVYLTALDRKTLRKTIIEEAKQTLNIPCLLNDETTKNFKPFEVCHVSYAILDSYRYDELYLHLVIDPVSHAVLSWGLDKELSIKSIIYQTKTLKNIKILNFARKEPYLYNETLAQWLKQNNIKQSMNDTIASKSYLIIREFINSMKAECLNKENYESYSFNALHDLIDLYINFWNNKRISKGTNWLTCAEYAKKILRKMNKES